MLLNNVEFRAMNNPVRRFVQRFLEVKRLRNLSDLASGKSILEIGCGSGYGTRLIKSHFQPKSITAIDLDRRMVELAKKSNTDKSIIFAVGDAARLTYADKTFDAIVDFGIIHHIPNWEKCLQELYRVLKPRGQIIIEDGSIESFETFVGKGLKKLLAHPYKDMYRLEEFLQQLKLTGFKEIKVKRYYLFGGFLYFCLVAKK